MEQDLKELIFNWDSLDARAQLPFYGPFLKYLHLSGHAGLIQPGRADSIIFREFTRVGVLALAHNDQPSDRIFGDVGGVAAILPVYMANHFQRILYSGQLGEAAKWVDMRMYHPEFLTSETGFSGDNVMESIREQYINEFQNQYKAIGNVIFAPKSPYRVVVIRTWEGRNEDREALLPANLLYHVMRQIIDSNRAGTITEEVEIETVYAYPDGTPVAPDGTKLIKTTNKELNRRKLNKAGIIANSDYIYALYVEPVPTASTTLNPKLVYKGAAKVQVLKPVKAEQAKAHKQAINCALGNCHPESRIRPAGLIIEDRVPAKPKEVVPPPARIRPDEIDCSRYTRKQLNAFAEELKLPTDTKESDIALCQRVKTKVAALYASSN